MRILSLSEQALKETLTKLWEENHEQSEQKSVRAEQKQ